MFLKKAKSSTDPELRSLLQKAARRGHIDLVKLVLSRLFALGDDRWVRSRAVVLTYEECWPLGQQLALDSSQASKTNAIVRLASAVKHKDAAGLGTLAYAFAENDPTALDFAVDPRAVKIVAAALARPNDYWAWLTSNAETTSAAQSVTAARRYVAATTWPWDRAFVLAAAYLSCTRPFVSIESRKSPGEAFPFWCAIDKHTPTGKSALNDVAKKLNLNRRQLTWASFYFESANTNELLVSPWWQSEIEWRFAKLGIQPLDAASMWSSAREEYQGVVSAAARLLEERLHRGSDVYQRTGGLWGTNA